MTERDDLREVAALFLKLGFTAFGGPAAHIAMMRDEVVTRRKWVTEQRFLDLLGASNLIPGPSSTELAIYLGYTRAGPPGLVLAGVLFILPAMVVVLAIAWAYVAYGSLPQAGAVLYGIKPVIIAVIVQAIYGLSRTAVKNVILSVVVITALATYLLGMNPLFQLFGLGIAVMLWENRGRLAAIRVSKGNRRVPLFLPAIPIALLAPAGGAVAFSLVTLFLTFLKIGATVFGSGYVLLAFLRDDFVDRLGWLTDQQLVDAVAVGQFTPGPVFTTATFIGYLVGNWPGAIVSTFGIFLPSFVFVAVVFRFVPQLRASSWTSSFLDGANAAAIGLMAAVSWQLGVTSIVDPFTGALAMLAFVTLVRFKVNSAWLVLCGAVAGIIWSSLATLVPGIL